MSIKNMDQLVSIIIPAYNEEKTIGKIIKNKKVKNILSL